MEWHSSPVRNRRLHSLAGLLVLWLLLLARPVPAPAELTSAEDAYTLGMSFELSQNIEEAIHWYTLAAEQGHAMAQFSLGDIYARDERAQDYAAALHWYLKAAEQDNAPAQLAAGVLYADGLGTQRNHQEANRWFRRAAGQGNRSAQFNLGIAYDHGYGVPVDPVQAFGWFRMAAEQGLADAQYNIGIMYAGGDGVEQDPVRAYRWINKAAEQGHPTALAARAELERILTPAQISLGSSNGLGFDPSGPIIAVPDFKPIPAAQADQ
jgi:hypothetical protein